MRIMCLVLFLAGCANEQISLVNDKGEKRYCYNVHGGGFDRIPAAAEFNKCLNDAGAAGFKREER